MVNTFTWPWSSVKNSFFSHWYLNILWVCHNAMQFWSNPNSNQSAKILFQLKKCLQQLWRGFVEEDQGIAQQWPSSRSWKLSRQIQFTYDIMVKRRQKHNQVDNYIQKHFFIVSSKLYVSFLMQTRPLSTKNCAR